MEPELERLLRTPALEAGRTIRVCANEAQVAAYVDGALDTRARQSCESHIAGCKTCLEQLSFLVRSHESAGVTNVPVELLARAKSLVPEKRRFAVEFSWRWATAALAACLLLVGLLALAASWRRQTSKPAVTVAGALQPQPSFAPPPSDTPRNPDALAYSNSPAAPKPSARKAEPEVPVVRGANTDSRTPVLISPHEGEALSRGSLVKWKSVPEVVSYEVSIQKGSGETVLTRTSDTPSLAIPADGSLSAGEKYFVLVRAQFRDGKTAQSRAVSFRLVD